MCSTTSVLDLGRHSLGRFDHQLVVHLHDQGRVEALERPVHPRHGVQHQIGRATLWTG